MHEQFDPVSKAYVVRDPDGVVRQVLHRQVPFSPTARTPQLAARAYLVAHSALLDLKPQELANLDVAPVPSPINAGTEYRITENKNAFDLTTVGYQQTYFGLPVWRAGLTVNVKHNPFQIISSTSTAHSNIDAKKPSAAAVKRYQNVTARQLQTILKLPSNNDSDTYDFRSLKINRTRFIVYKYDRSVRLPKVETPAGAGEQPLPRRLPTLPVPAPDNSIRDGRHYVAVEILFTLSTRRWGRLNWIVIVEVETTSILYLRALVDNVDGMVYVSDPISQGGTTAPSDTAANLNPFRASVTLQDLAAPVGGNQALSGTYVQVFDHEAPAVAPPSEATGTNFDYDTRTDNFAAVNTYHHCTEFFRLIAGLGFTINNYFDGTTFPVQVDHRGRFGTLDGIEINASCGGNATSTGIGLPDFELADLTDTANPLGIAADGRVILHEFGGHGILWDHVDSANLGFSHSAGDSFAAILHDPDNLAADRFLTFPWLLTTRRHDRPVSGGWAWGGVMEDANYNSEQILSTTNFRIYRSIGGDSPFLETRQFAARYMAYLMLMAVSTLTPATNPTDATGFESALVTADLADWTSEGHAGGAYGKVIRWAFEKQGMFQPAGAPTPVTVEGAPPDVDVYIDDGRQGEYQYQPVHWQNQSVWNRLAADGGTTHEEPIVGVTNYAYVKIKNRGTLNATNVVVKGFHCIPSSGLVWPDDWQAMATPQLAAPDVAPNNSAELTVGPFEWIPSQLDHECMLMIASADGDPSNIDNFTAGDSIPEWRLVPHDNNIGQRNVAPVPAGGGLKGLLTAFDPRRFTVRNPHPKFARIEINPKFPTLLARGGWEFVFENPGGRAFSLSPGQSREIVLRMKPGADFSPQEIDASSDRIISLQVVANGIVVGGMSYQLDPKLAAARPQFPGKPPKIYCAEKARDLLSCFDVPADKVKCVRVSKVTVEIELDDCGC